MHEWAHRSASKKVKTRRKRAAKGAGGSSGHGAYARRSGGARRTGVRAQAAREDAAPDKRNLRFKFTGDGPSRNLRLIDDFT